MIGTKTEQSPIEANLGQSKIVLIDADSLMYFSSYGSEEDQVLSETKLSEKIYDILNIVSESYDIEKSFIFIKGKDNFRYKIYPDYKKNRPEKPPIIDSLNLYLIDQFGAIQSHNAESDDYVYTYSQKPEYKGRCIICSVDKDMLQIPGIHYDYQKNKYHIIDEEEATYRLAIQMLMGDTADNIKGLKGYGIKRAEKVIQKGMTPYQCLRAIYKEYSRKNPLPKDEIRLNYKLLKLQDVNV